jgi:hypothetical protein
MPFLKRIGLCALGGALLGVLLLGIGLIRALVAIVAGRHVSFEGVWPELGWYVAAFAAAGIVGGLLWSLRGNRAGRFTIVIVGAAAAVGGISIAEYGAPWQWSHDSVVTWIGLSVVFGAAVEIGVEYAMSRIEKMGR